MVVVVVVIVVDEADEAPLYKQCNKIQLFSSTSCTLFRLLLFIAIVVVVAVIIIIIILLLLRCCASKGCETNEQNLKAEMAKQQQRTTLTSNMLFVVNVAVAFAFSAAVLCWNCWSL